MPKIARIKEPAKAKLERFDKFCLLPISSSTLHWHSDGVIFQIGLCEIHRECYLHQIPSMIQLDFFGNLVETGLEIGVQDRPPS